MGFWSLSMMIGDKRSLFDAQEELDEVNNIIKRDCNDKKFDKVGYTNEKFKLEKRVNQLKRKLNK